MTILRCSLKLMTEAGIHQSDLVALPESDNDWYVHLFFINRKKYLISTHAKTLFSFIVPDLKRDAIRKLPEIFKQGLESTLDIENISSAYKARILSNCEGFQFAKTVNRSVTGSMNDLVYQYLSMVEHNYDSRDIHSLAKISRQLNRVPMSYIRYGLAIEKFLKLNGITNQDIRLTEFC